MQFDKILHKETNIYFTYLKAGTNYIKLQYTDSLKDIL